MNTEAPPSLETVLAFVKEHRGFDFTGYKRSSLERRIRKRMEEVKCPDFGAYLEHVELHPDEFAQLFNTILINVTAFYRDPSLWDHLRDTVVPELLRGRPADSPLRVWSAGCASGEEAYSLAMVLCDALGEDAFRARVKIYATDVDEEALHTARQAVYPARAVEEVPPEALSRYFERYDTRYVFRQDLRRSVIFGRNDLVQDAPISRIDLLLCRNTLMYFNAEAQSHVLRRLHFGLAQDGVLVLGRSEMLLGHTELFQPEDLKRRVFRKVVSGGVRERLQFITAADGARQAPSLTDDALEAGATAQLVVHADGVVAVINHAARDLFGLSDTDVGRQLQDLELSYRPVDLRSSLDRLNRERRIIALDGVRWARPGRQDDTVLDVRLTPLVAGVELRGAMISYLDVSRTQRLQDELTGSKRELEQAYEELQSTVEELETTNEELQSTNEELETTNEELQSTNEELETMNEELQSTNEELETMNDELRTRTLELDEVNAFLETILASLGLAVAVLDTRQTVQVWNGNSTDLWGLRPDEAVGHHFMGLDIGLPVERLRPLILAGLQGERGEVTLDAVNRRGRPVTCSVTAMPLEVREGPPTGVILLMDPAELAA